MPADAGSSERPLKERNLSTASIGSIVFVEHEPDQDGGVRLERRSAQPGDAPSAAEAPQQGRHPE